MSDPIIGEQLFVDGITRLCFEYDRGQYVVEDGERVDGQRLPLADGPGTLEKGTE